MPKRLTPRELGELAEKLANAQSDDEARDLRARIMRGFYGMSDHELERWSREGQSPETRR